MLKKGQWPILVVNTLAVLFFLLSFVRRQNYEFVIYIGVIIFFIVVILASNRKVNYPNSVLWGLTGWALLHMAGGNVFIRGTRLYEIMLVPLTQDLFRYDQFVHIVGFAVATCVMYLLLKPYLGGKSSGIGLGIVIVMAGLGVGALNEIVEFVATVLVPSTGVGGYLNTSLDLVGDLIGAILAWAYIRWRRGRL